MTDEAFVILGNGDVKGVLIWEMHVVRDSRLKHYLEPWRSKASPRV